MEHTEINETATQVAIRELSPHLKEVSNHSFHAVVTLVWPYSSSDRQLSLLVAEPDFRLRHQNGQVKVFFRHTCAEHVARTKVGIGDHVVLALRGARWVENDSAMTNSGRGVHWDLYYERELHLKVSSYFAVITVELLHEHKY
jgi:hypothetical protein